jgi:hypothetical protein
MSPNTADHIRGMTRIAGRKVSAWSPSGDQFAPIESEFARIVNRSYGKARAAIDGVMGFDAAGNPIKIYNDLRTSQRTTMDALDTLNDFFGDSDQSMTTAARWLWGGKGRQPTQMAITDTARALGIDIKWIRRAALQESATGFPSRAVPGMPFSGIRSPSLQMGLILGGAGFGIAQRTMNIPLALAAAGSPQVLLHGARQISNLSRLASAGRGVPLRAAEQTAIAAGQEPLLEGTTAILNRGVAAQDAPARRINLTGGN